MAGAATCHERLARSIGEIRHAVTALQAKARSQEVVLSELGQRASTGQGLSGWVAPGKTRAASPAGNRIRDLESSLASLRTRVELLEEARPGPAAFEADIQQRMDDLQRQVELQAKALEAALFFGDKDKDKGTNIACSDVHATQLQSAESSSLEQRLTDLEVGLALQRRSSDDAIIRLRSEVTRSLKFAKVEGARLEGAMEAKLDELDHQMRASAHGHEVGGLVSDQQVLDQAMQAATSRISGSLQANLRVLGDRQHCLDLQISSVTTGLRACGEEQERLAREATVHNDRMEKQFAELSEVCRSSNQAADAQQQRRLLVLEEQQIMAAVEQQSRVAELEKQVLAKVSCMEEQESSQTLHGRLEEVIQSKTSEEVAQQSKLIEELQEKMKEQTVEMSCFAARCHGEFSEVLHQAGQASEASAVAGSAAKRGQEAARRLWDEETEFREHLAAAVGSLRAEIVDRHAMIEDRMTRSQGRVAQELGEQRARADSRMASLEEQLLSGSLAEILLRDVEELSQASVKREVQVAKRELMQTANHRFDCILGCLSLLYMKVGLSPKDALATLQKALKPESEQPDSSERFTPRDRRNDRAAPLSARESSTPRSRREVQPKLRVRRQEEGPGACQAAARQTPRQGNLPGPSRLGSPGGPGGSPTLASPRPSSASGLAPPGPPSLGGRGTAAGA